MVSARRTRPHEIVALIRRKDSLWFVKAKAVWAHTETASGTASQGVIGVPVSAASGIESTMKK